MRLHFDFKSQCWLMQIYLFDLKKKTKLPTVHERQVVCLTGSNLILFLLSALFLC